MTQLLLIDDEQSNLRVLSLSLRSDGYEVITATNGSEGVEIFKKHLPDIVLTDIKMPGKDGIEVLKEIKDIEPDAEVIIITGHGDIDNAVEALKYGASDFINKPISDEVLSIALDRAREKLKIKRQLKQYTDHLEKEIHDATTELRRRSNFQSKLINCSNDGIIATDHNFVVVVFNPAAERIFGYSREETLNKLKADDIYTWDILDTLVEDSPRRKNGEGLPTREMEIVAKNGERIPVRFSGTFLYEAHEMMGSVAFFQDLREIKRLEAELVRSERLAAVGQTVAGVAHGVKNLLQGFKSGSYLVELGLNKDDRQKLERGWNMVQKNIRRTSELVMDLLSYSKERQPELQWCEPNDIANEVYEMVQKQAEENNIEIIRDFDPDIGSVRMDPQTIHRCLLNLVSNAVDACIFDEDHTKNWQIVLKTRRENGKMIRFVVSDNGMGMSETIKEKIFHSFFSTKGHLGTGLGLLVTRKHIEEHGGTIDLHSSPGKGSEFIVRLPYEKT